jgi:hypothetical protein
LNNSASSESIWLPVVFSSSMGSITYSFLSWLRPLSLRDRFWEKMLFALFLPSASFDRTLDL